MTSHTDNFPAYDLVCSKFLRASIKTSCLQLEASGFAVCTCRNADCIISAHAIKNVILDMCALSVLSSITLSLAHFTMSFNATDLSRVAILQVQKEFENLLNAKTGDPTTPFAYTSAASQKVKDGINAGIQ